MEQLKAVNAAPKKPGVKGRLVVVRERLFLLGTCTPQKLELNRLLRHRPNHPHSNGRLISKCIEGDELAIRFVITADGQAAVF